MMATMIPAVQDTAWPREPSHLLAIALSSRTQYDACGKALVTRAVFPHLGDELVLFVKVMPGAENGPIFEVGSFPGLALRLQDAAGWRRCELGDYRSESRHVRALASGMKPFNVLGRWFFQSHVHVVLVDCRHDEPQIGRVFELAVPPDEPTVRAVRDGRVGAGASVALSFVAGTAVEGRRYGTPSGAWLPRDVDAESLETLLMGLIEDFVRRFELIDRMRPLRPIDAVEDTEAFGKRIMAFGGEDWLGLALDVLAVCDEDAWCFAQLCWNEVCSIPLNDEPLRMFWRDRFELDMGRPSAEAMARRAALVESWIAAGLMTRRR